MLLRACVLEQYGNYVHSLRNKQWRFHALKEKSYLRINEYEMRKLRTNIISE